MNYEYYADLKIEGDFQVFDFESTGKFGSIHKRTTFESTENPEIFNLAFGDVGDDGEIDDYSRSNNGDRNKILATLVYVIEMYTDRFPNNWVYFQGSTEGRTRLYRIVAGLYFEVLSEKFEIFARVENSIDFVPFRKNMKIIGFLY